MKKIFTMLKAFLIIPVIIAYPVLTNAQSKVGTTIGQFLKIDPSSRIAAMGNAGTSIFGEASSLYYNPASIGRLNNSDAQFTYSEWLADITFNYAAICVKVDKVGTFALQVTALNSGDIAVRTVDQPLGTGENYNVQDFALGVAYGLMLTDRVSVGLLINYLQETIWHDDLSDFAVNLGVLYQVEPNGLTIGASLLNFGPRASYSGRDLYADLNFDPTKHGGNDQIPVELRTDSYSLPTLFRIGISYPFIFNDENRFTLSVDALHPNDNNESANIGGELILMKDFFLRGGYRSLFLTDSEGGLELGLGAKVNFGGGYNIRFDYAWADYGRLLRTNRFTIGVGF